MDEGTLIAIFLILLVIVIPTIIILNATDDNKPEANQPQPTTPPKIVEIHSSEYNAMELLLNTDTSILVKEIAKYLKTTIKKGCEDIRSKSTNQMLCGVQIKEYITTSRNIYREHTTLFSLSGLSKEAWHKLVDSTCVMIHDSYFGNITNTPIDNN